MVKLTKKTYLKALKGTRFIAAVSGHTLKEVRAKVKETKELPCIYTISDVVEHSNFVVFLSEEKEGSRRDFAGKNEYYKDCDMFYHVSNREGHTTIFLNM